MKATGEFEVKLQPLEPHARGGGGIRFGRMAIDKLYHGDLKGHSQGEMLTALTDVEGSAGYVAIEQVSGDLHGMFGTFALQHYGIRDQGENRLILEVVPESGSGELSTLRGRMAIRIEEGRHFYEFEYEMDSMIE